MGSSRRALRLVVWGCRSVGWALVVLALASGFHVRALTGWGFNLGLLSSIALGVLGIVWVLAIELFLTFFDQYLSHN